MAHFQKVVGTLSKVQPSRNFIDGVFCQTIEITDVSGNPCRFDSVFFPTKLFSLLKSGAYGEFYFWNSHCYAFRSDHEYVEDIDGARASFFKRDARLLLLMAASVILLPYALFVAIKKLIRGGPRRQMQRFLANGAC